MPDRDGSVDLSMPLGLMAGRPFDPFSRAISSRCSAFIRSNSVILSDSLATSSFSCEGDRPSRSSGGFTHSLNGSPSRCEKIMQPRPEFCRCYVFEQSRVGVTGSTAE